MKTIKQLANEIGVSKQAIHQRLKREPLSTLMSTLTSTVDGAVYINEQGEALIKQAFQRAPSISVDSVDVNVDGVGINVDGHVDGLLVNILHEQLLAKDKQIEELNARLKEQSAANKELTAALEHTTASLHAAQALHAGTMKTQLIAEKSETADVVQPDKPEAELEKKTPPKNIFQRFFKRG